MRRGTMSCSRVRGLLEEYHEGSLPAGEEAGVAAHLSRCDSCESEWRQIARFAAVLGGLPAADPGAGLVGAISARAAALPSPRERWLAELGGRRLAAAVGVCVVALAGVRYLAALGLEPVEAWAAGLVSSAVGWLAAVVSAGGPLARALAGVAGAFRLAADAAAPTVGLYLAAEVAAVAAVVLVLSWARVRVHGRVVGLVV